MKVNNGDMPTLSAESGKAAADEIAGMFSAGFFDEKMVSDVAAVVARHMQTDPVRAALVEALKGMLVGTTEDCGKIRHPSEQAVIAAFSALRAAGVVL